MGTIWRQALFVVRPRHFLNDGLSFFQRKEPKAWRYRWRRRRLRLLIGTLLRRLARSRFPRWLTLPRRGRLPRLLILLPGSLSGSLRALLPRSLRPRALHSFRRCHRHLSQQSRSV